MFNIFKRKSDRIHNLEVEVYTLSDMNIEARLANLERRVKRQEQDIAEMTDLFNNVISNCTFVIKAMEKFLSKEKPTKKTTSKKLKVTNHKKSDPIQFQPKWVENAVSYDNEGRMVYSPKKTTPKKKTKKTTKK